MRSLFYGLWCIVAGILLVMVGCSIFVGKALAHDGYESWMMPDAPNVSCCNNTDCRPTRAYLDHDGAWRAWNGHKWLRIPPNKILPTDLKKDGRNHLCEKNEAVYCFSPAEPKS